MAKDTRLGELNGKWALLFRVNMVVLPIFVGGIMGFGAWAVSEIHDNDKVSDANREAIIDLKAMRTDLELVKQDLAVIKAQTK